MGAIVAASLNVSASNPLPATQFVRGFQHALLVAAVITFAAALIAVATVRKDRQLEEAPVLDMAA